MKKGFFHLLSMIPAIFFLALPISVFAQNYIQSFENGKVDWSNGVVEAAGIGVPPNDAANPAQGRAIAKNQAKASARQNLYDLIRNLKIDSKYSVRGLIDQQDITQEALKRCLMRCRLVDISYLSNGSVKATVALRINGTFAELVLPKDILTIDTVLQPKRPLKKAESFTGLVVDCRGLRIKPAMVPVIVDEDGGVVYGSAYVSRDYAVQQGMVSYVKDMTATQKNPRVAPRPLNVKGIRTTKTGLSDIVISNADAAKIRGAASNLSLMQKCRVVIVLD